MAYSLIEILVNARPADELTSIKDHLVNLLNTKRGSLSHLPKYGLPDINFIYSGLPHSLKYLETSIIQLIECYEKRLKNINVISKELQKCEFVLKLEIIGDIKNIKPVFFEAIFLPGGKIIIEKYNFEKEHMY